MRTPLCGRNFEYFSEDPYLISEMAVPVIEGIESSDVGACVKHFAVNNQETERNWVNVEIDERTLREIYLPAFEAAVNKAKVRSIMGAYNLFRGVHCCEKSHAIKAQYFKNGIANFITNGGHAATAVAEPVIFNTPHGYNNGGIKYDKAPTLTALGSYQHNNHIIEPIRVGALPRPNGELSTSQDKTELYAVPSIKDKNVYEVKDGFITIKGKQYPIKLPDGYYIIRKLTVTECERLQTLPDGYTQKEPTVSASQAYKGIGNGWTAEVIIHILSNALKNIPKDEEIIVLSMYDGIGTGRYCLDKMGFTNVKYFAYEIDKYAKKIALSNYPDIIQMGDAFQLRNLDWALEI